MEGFHIFCFLKRVMATDIPVLLLLYEMVLRSQCMKKYPENIALIAELYPEYVAGVQRK